MKKRRFTSGEINGRPKSTIILNAYLKNNNNRNYILCHSVDFLELHDRSIINNNLYLLKWDRYTIQTQSKRKHVCVKLHYVIT